MKMSIKTPIKAIAQNCTECMGSAYEVPLCHLDGCPLWPYRMGCRPGNKKYAERVRRTWASKPDAAKELTDIGKTLADLLGKGHLATPPSKKRPVTKG